MKDNVRKRISIFDLSNALRHPLAVFLAVTFLVPAEALLAFPETQPVETSRPAINPLSLSVLPQHLGTIEERYQGNSDLSVVLIQDAHGIPEAQRSIRDLILYFRDEYGIRLAGFEGASARLDAGLIKSFPSAEAVEKVSEEYMERGELTGASAAALSDDGAMIFQGLEDWSLYQKGLGLYLAALKRETGLLEKAAVRRQSLEAEKERVYSSELLAVDRALNAFERNDAGILEALTACARVKAPEPGSELALILEETRNGGADVLREKEIRAIALDIKSRMSAGLLEVPLSEAKRFHESEQSFQTSTIAPEAFASFLREWGAANAVPFPVPEAVHQGIRDYQKLRDLEGSALLKSFELYARSIKEILFQNNAERDLDRKSRGQSLFERVIRLEVSREQWREWQSEGGVLASEFEKEELLAHRLFYENADSRDQAFFDHLTREMKKTKADSSVMIAGGFHSGGLTERLRASGISYLKISPAISAVPASNRYRDHLRGELSWKDYFTVEKEQIDLNGAFIRAFRDRLLETSKEDQKAALKKWRDRVVQRLADQGRLTKAGEYTAYLDELAVLPETWGGQARLSRFLEGLQGLDQKGQAGQENILGLLKDAAIASLEAAGLASGSRMPRVSRLAESAEALIRSELRAEQQNPWETFEGVDVETLLEEIVSRLEDDQLSALAPAAFQAVKISPSAKAVVSGRVLKMELERANQMLRIFRRTAAGESLWNEALYTVLREALSNAKEGRNDASADVRVELDVEISNGELVIRLRDYGPGISEDILRNKLDGWREQSHLSTKSKSIRYHGMGFQSMYHHAKSVGGLVEVETVIPSARGRQKVYLQLQPGASIKREETLEEVLGTTVTLRVPVEVRQSRSELRSKEGDGLRKDASVHESMMGQLIYPRTILYAPESSKYSQAQFFEAPVAPALPEDKALKIFQAAFNEYNRVGSKYREIGKRHKSLKEGTSVLAVDLPAVFYSPSERVGITHVIQISTRRRAILISKKFLESLDPQKSFDVKLVALYLHIGQILIERYDELQSYFRYENQNYGVVSRRLQNVYRRVEQSLENDFSWDQEAFIENMNFNPSDAKLKHLRIVDQEFRQKERQRLGADEADLLAKDDAIRKILEGWDPVNGYSDSEIPEIAGRIAAVVPEIETADQSRQQAALLALKHTIQSLQKRAHYYESEGEREKARQFYKRAEEFYKASQKIDFGGYFPLRVQEELVYFLLRSGSLEELSKELSRLLNVHYVPTRRRPDQLAVHDAAYPLWLILSAPDLLYKLQYYRVGADAQQSELIEKIEKTLTRAYFRELKKQLAVEEKFAVDLTRMQPDELKNPMLIPVAESGDVFSFAWEKMGVNENHVEVRLEASRWVNGPERPDPVGYLDFVLLRDEQGRWTARTSRNQWPALFHQGHRNSMGIDEATHRSFRGIPSILMQLALRLIRKSGAEVFSFDLAVDLQKQYELPYRDKRGGFKQTLNFKNLGSSALVEAPLKHLSFRHLGPGMPSEQPRSELRSESFIPGDPRVLPIRSELRAEEFIVLEKDADVERGPDGRGRKTWVFRVLDRTEFRDVFDAISAVTGIPQTVFKRDGFIGTVRKAEDGSYVPAGMGRVDLLEPDSSLWRVPAGQLLKASVTLPAAEDSPPLVTDRMKVLTVLEQEAELLVTRLRPDLDQDKAGDIARRLVRVTDFPGWTEDPDAYFRSEAVIQTARDFLIAYLTGVAALFGGIIFYGISVLLREAGYNADGFSFFMGGVFFAVFYATLLYTPWFILSAFHGVEGIRIYLSGDLTEPILKKDPEVLGYLAHEWIHSLKYSGYLLDDRGTSAAELLRRYELEKENRGGVSPEIFSETLRSSRGKRAHSLFAFFWRGRLLEQKKKEFLDAYRAVQGLVNVPEENRKKVFDKLDSDKLLDYRGYRFIQALMLRVLPGTIEGYARSFRLGGAAASLSDRHGPETGWRFLKEISRGESAYAAYQRALPRSKPRSEFPGKSPNSSLELSVVEDFDRSSQEFLEELVRDLKAADLVITIPVYNEVQSAAQTLGYSLPGTHGQVIDADKLVRDMRESLAAHLKKNKDQKALILVVGETRGDAASAAIKALSETAASIQSSSIPVRVYGKEERFAGLLGKKWALRLGMRAADKLGGDFVSIDGDMEIDRDYIEKITEPLSSGRADYVSPVYLRYWGRDDSALIALFGFPFFGAVTGKKLRMPNEGGFAAGKKLVSRLLQNDILWDSETLYESVFAAAALFEGMRAEDVWLGEKLHKKNPVFETTFDAYVKYAVLAMFSFLEGSKELWVSRTESHVEGLEELTIPEDVLSRPLDEIFLKGVDPIKLKEHFRADADSVKARLQILLPELLPVFEELEFQEPAVFGITSRQWARVVFSALKLYLSTGDPAVRAQIPGLVKPFFSARAAGFIKELAGLDNYGQGEELLNQQVLDFAREKTRMFSEAPWSEQNQNGLEARSELREDSTASESFPASSEFEETSLWKIARRVVLYLEYETPVPELPGLAVEIEQAVRVSGFKSFAAAARGGSLEMQALKVQAYLEKLALIADKLRRNSRGDAAMIFAMEETEKESLEAALAKILRGREQPKTHIVIPRGLSQIDLPESAQRHVVPSIEGITPGQLRFAVNSDAIAVIPGAESAARDFSSERIYALRAAGLSETELDVYYAGIVDKATRALVALVLAEHMTKAEQLKDKTARSKLITSVNLAFFGAAAEIDEDTLERLIRFDEKGLTVNVGMIFKRLTAEAAEFTRISRSA